MTTFEKIVRDELLDTVQTNLDLIQFAYRPGGGVGELAMRRALHFTWFCHTLRVLSIHLVFIDFLSAFNCIQSHISAGRLRSVRSPDPALKSGRMDLLPERWQCAKVSCILLALSFALNTNEYQYPRCHILKFADDSVIVSFLNISIAAHPQEQEQFAGCSERVQQNFWLNPWGPVSLRSNRNFGLRYGLPTSRTNRCRNYFVLAAVGLSHNTL